jgi:acyl-CoA thioester hydrolase
MRNRLRHCNAFATLLAVFVLRLKLCNRTMTDSYSTTVRVRYAETDQMGVVYHGNFFIWFEVGRVELLRQMGFEYKRMELEDDCFIVVAEARCRYLKPARYDDVLRIQTRVAESGNRIVRFAYEVFHDAGNELLATGETVHVICNRQGKPRTLPEKYRKVFGVPESPAGAARPV